VSKLLVVLGVLAATALSACGSSSSTTYCCVNGAYYSCGSTDDAQSCTEKCSRDSSKDSSCK